MASKLKCTGTRTERIWVTSKPKIQFIVDKLDDWSKQENARDILLFCDLYDLTYKEYKNLRATHPEIDRAAQKADQRIAARIKEAYWLDSDKRHYAKDFLSAYDVHHFEHLSALQKIASSTDNQITLKMDTVFETLKEQMHGRESGQISSAGLPTTSSESDAG